MMLSMLHVSHSNGVNAKPFYAPRAQAVCQRSWRPVLELDHTGAVKSGSLDEVRQLAMQASLFRIKFLKPEGPYLLNVDNTNVRGDHVCGESLWHVSDNGTHISTSVEWLFHLICTNGEVEVISSPYSRPDGWNLDPKASYVARKQDAKGNFGNITKSVIPMIWYVKGLGPGNPVYSNFLDGTRASGSLKDLFYMAELGEVRCMMRDRGYAFVANNVVVDRDANELNAQSLGHISQRFSQVALSFRETPYYWLASLTTDGRRDNTRYFVGNTQPRGHNNDFVALDWHVDSCWREVYVHDKDGMGLGGSLDELILLVSLGHRVRLQYDKTVLEANSVRISDRTVIAQSLEEVKRRGGQGGDKYFFNTDTLWKWTTAHTTGRVKTNLYKVKDMTSFDQNVVKSGVRWMVDTRTWKRVHSWPPKGNLMVDSMDVLIAAVKSGASIRFSLQQDTTAGFFFTNADNVRYDQERNTVYAQCLRHISDKRDQVHQNEYLIQPRPFHWFLMISSDGVMAMSAWKTEERTQLYDSISPEADITWFASY
ncbi:hypothetical protein ACOMHN_028196 [Nucella lapillus]